MTAHKIKLKSVLIVLLALAVLAGVWSVLRSCAALPCTAASKLSAPAYSESDKVLNAVALSYLVYGCETCDGLSGTVSELLDTCAMGILNENFGLKRADETDPASAAFDTSEFIRSHVGEFRFLADLKDDSSGFYGAAFCDDAGKCVWIAYAGAVTFCDALACGEFVLTPGLSRQEKMAVRLYETVLGSDEVQNQSYAVMLTGHSLGGALATMVACAGGLDAVTVNGADGIAVDKFRGMTGNQDHITRVSNYVTSPANGTVSFMDLVQRMMFLGEDTAVERHVYQQNGYTEDSHCAFSFVVLNDGAFEIPLSADR